MIRSLVHSKSSLCTFAYDEGALTGEGMHLRSYETVQASGIPISRRYKAFSLITDQVIGERTEVALSIYHPYRHIT